MRRFKDLKKEKQVKEAKRLREAAYERAQKAFVAECCRLVDIALERYGYNLTDRLYLVGRRYQKGGSFIWKELTLATKNEIDEWIDWIPISSDCIPRHLTKDSLYIWFREILGREPLWVFDGC